jgi:diguanylate cyclase (GGDEF)-like protein
MPTLATNYNYELVFVSVLISIVASFAALSLEERVRAANTVTLRRLWLTCGSIAMGIGIWSMHYLGMLALNMPVPVFYHWPTVLLSLLLAVAASGVALWVVSAELLSLRRLLAGGVLMGAGIGGMHYVGMAAMRSVAMEHYDSAIVVLSVVAAVVFSCVALWIAFATSSGVQRSILVRLAASTVMGLGIASMHYIAMAAVHFTYSDMPFSMDHTVRVNVLGESVIVIVTALILLIALGTATLDKLRYRDLQKAHAELMLAQQALLEIQRQLRDANALLSELSVRDGLTGLYNRRHFDAALDTELRRAARNLKPISMLMIDVDAFKVLNDSYGHQRGDDCLREVSRVLEAHPHRGYDVLARYGGEEFALLLPDADAASALVIAETLRRSVYDLCIENMESPVAEVVTISIGVCCQSPHLGDDNEGFVREADEALYTAKRLGRNRVIMSSAVTA